MKKWTVKAALCATALQFSGCIIATGDAPPPAGTLSVEWSINGQRHPADCAAFGVDRLELLIFTRFGALIDHVDASCEAFAISVGLVEGRYHTDATLIDSVGRSATLTQSIGDIAIIEDTDLLVVIDFPVDSFFGHSCHGVSVGASRVSRDRERAGRSENGGCSRQTWTTEHRPRH